MSKFDLLTQVELARTYLVRARIHKQLGVLYFQIEQEQGLDPFFASKNFRQAKLYRLGAKDILMYVEQELGKNYQNASPDEWQHYKVLAKLDGKNYRQWTQYKVGYFGYSDTWRNGTV